MTAEMQTHKILPQVRFVQCGSKGNYAVIESKFDKDWYFLHLKLNFPLIIKRKYTVIAK